MSKNKMKNPKDLDGVFFKISSKDDDIIEILCKVKDRTTFIKNAMVFYYKALKQNPSLVERSIVIDEYDIPIYMQQPHMYANQHQFMQNQSMFNVLDNNNQEENNIENQVDDEIDNTNKEEEEFDYTINQDVEW